MIITLIGLALLIVGIVLTIIWNKKRWELCNYENAIEICAFVCSFVGSAVTFLSIIFILINVVNYDVEYQDMLCKKEMLEYRIEHMEENITGNEMLYNDIVEFNNELRSEKKWANSPWTNWFNNKNVASLDYVEMSND